MLRRMLQKMMGEDLEYRNQYQDIQDAIDDFEQYLYVRHSKEIFQIFSFPVSASQFRSAILPGSFDADLLQIRKMGRKQRISIMH